MTIPKAEDNQPREETCHQANRKWCAQKGDNERELLCADQDALEFSPDKSWNQVKQVLCGLAYKLARRFVRRTKILLQLRAQRSRRDRMQDRFENFRWSFLLIIF